MTSTMKKQKNPNTFVKIMMLIGYFISHPVVVAWKKTSSFFKQLNYKRLLGKIARGVGSFMHWLIFGLLLPKRYRNITKKEIYRIIFKADTPAGKRFDVWLLILIGLNLLVLMLDSFEAVHTNMRWVIMTLEWIFTFIFTLEYYLRIYCLQRPWKYILSFYGIIDFLSIFPAYLSLIIPATQTLTVLRVLRTLRIFRIFKMQRFLQESFHLINALRRSLARILIFMMFVFIVAIILGAVMYMFEEKKNPAMSSIPTAIYWAVVTITTVGYGDIAPVTSIGQFISTIVMLLGYSIIAVPTGIVVGETINEYKHERDDKQGEEFNIPEEFNEYEDSRQQQQTAVVATQQQRYCPHCGHVETDETSRYCRYCGTLLSRQQPVGWISDFFGDGNEDVR